MASSIADMGLSESADRANRETSASFGGNSPGVLDQSHTPFWGTGKAHHTTAAMVMRGSPYNSAAADLLRQARIKAGLKQSELADRLGVRQQFVSQYETGERRLDVGEVQAICDALGLSIVDFAVALTKPMGRSG